MCVSTLKIINLEISSYVNNNLFKCSKFENMKMLPFASTRSARCCFIEFYDHFFMLKKYSCFLSCIDCAHFNASMFFFSSRYSSISFNCTRYGHVVVEQHFFPFDFWFGSAFASSAFSIFFLRFKLVRIQIENKNCNRRAMQSRAVFQIRAKREKGENSSLKMHQL